LSLQTHYGFKKIGCHRNRYIRSSISLIATDNDGEQLDFGREDNNQETERTEDNSLSSLRAQLNENDQGIDNALKEVNNEREDNNQEIERAEDNSLNSLKAQLNNDVMIEEIDFEREDNNREIERTVNNSLDSLRAQLAKENSEEIVKSLLPKCYVIISNLQSGSNIGTVFSYILA
jgi:predicted RND superfamily exporter protein